MSEIWRRKAIGDLDSLLEKHISNIQYLEYLRWKRNFEIIKK